MVKIRDESINRTKRKVKPRRVKSCPYCGRQIGFEWGNYYAHVGACERKAKEQKEGV